MTTTHTQIRRMLEAQLDTLVKRVGRIETDLRRSHDPDWVEAATEVENDDVLEHLDEAARLEVAGIRSALKRLDDGTYDACAKCGKAIGERRLEAMPTATRCLTCSI